MDTWLFEEKFQVQLQTITREYGISVDTEEPQQTPQSNLQTQTAASFSSISNFPTASTTIVY
ncbi:hypothetical protein SCLCIDRAFT_34542 [Scleroderma citrinum Foug A]|uniref:Uncharacterized protein n=1 Tax=Scleroderma citrinum Foug A TaxID=1036808 RepID=A0A0C3D1C2_9AGAM|nr:hypothetical protein SCLCIDRAFT_34542 [Scleroderma citrinum Foug A]